MDKVNLGLGLLAAFVLYYMLQWLRAPTMRDVLENIGAPPELQEHAAQFEQTPGYGKVADGVYVACNYALGNSIMLVGTTGTVIVDTTESLDAATLIAKEFKTITDKPVEAIVYTHHHSDHIMGSKAFISEDQDPPQIWAHHLFLNQESVTARKSMALYTRAQFQFGTRIPHGKFGGTLKMNIGQRRMDPTHFVYDDNMEVTLAGIRIRFLHIPGETSDHLGLWLPEKKILLSGDDLYKAYPNLYAIRGTVPRDVNDWVMSLDKMRRLRPECIVPSHGLPECGEEHVYQLLSDYMSGVQFVHDQTVRYINKGMHPEEIVRKVQLPAELARHPYLGQFYGNVPWSVKGVYNSYLGWFSGFAEDLNPLSPSERAQRMVQLMGTKGLLKAAQSALDKGDSQWALELASHVYNREPANTWALEIRKVAMANLAGEQISNNGRNYYMSMILKDADQIGKFDIRSGALQVPIDQIFMSLRLRLKAEDIPEGEHLVGCFHFTDSNRTICATLHKGIIELDDNELESYDFRLSTTEMILKEIIAGQRYPLASYLSGAIRVEGGILKLRKFMSYIDRTV